MFDPEVMKRPAIKSQRNHLSHLVWLECCRRRRKAQMEILVRPIAAKLNIWPMSSHFVTAMSWLGVR